MRYWQTRNTLGRALQANPKQPDVWLVRLIRLAVGLALFLLFLAAVGSVHQAALALMGIALILTFICVLGAIGLFGLVLGTIGDIREHFGI